MDLSNSQFLFLDCQTTGLSPRKAELLELGWSLSFNEEEIQTRLARPNLLEGIPKKVWKMTGLSPADLESAKAPLEIWEEVIQSVKACDAPVSAVVIHYSQFERPFLEALHLQVAGEETLPWPVLCTYRLARRLHQDLPARSLRAMSGHLGYVLPEEHRSQGHVAATQKIWRNLIDTLKAQESVITWSDLQAWLKTPAKPKSTARKYLVARETRLDLPEGPGVYEMHSMTGTILYIGKATSLRDRVNSYFRQRRTTRTRLKELMTQVTEVRVTPTATAIEAALLESDRIKEIQPPYNHALRTLRPLVFASKDLSSYIEKPDPDHSWGPFVSLRPFESLERLRFIQRGELENVDVLLLAHPPEEIKRALEELLSKVGGTDLTTLSLLDLLKSGKRLENTGIVAPQEKEEDEEEEDIEASLCRKLKRAVRLVHHAHWLCWLTESVVSWEIPKDPEGRYRFLEIREGKVFRSGYRAPWERIRRTGPRVSFRSRQLHMDLKMYERMRILISELSSYVKRGVAVEAELSASRVFSSSDSTWLTRILSFGGDCE